MDVLTFSKGTLPYLCRFRREVYNMTFLDSMI